MDVVISAIAHRTGSTLVQRIFNKRERTLVWGEHGGVLSPFVQAFDAAERFCRKGEKEKNAYLASPDGSAAWTARMSPSGSNFEAAKVACVRAFLDTWYQEMRDGRDLIGFKEVRYGRREIELLRQAYPAASIVLLVRDPVDVWRSMPEWGRSLDELIQIYNENGPDYLELSRRPGFFLVRYEDVTAKDPKTLDVLSELSLLTVPEVVEVVDGKRLRSTRHEVPRADVHRIHEECAPVLRDLGYLTVTS